MTSLPDHYAVTNEGVPVLAGDTLTSVTTGDGGKRVTVTLAGVIDPRRLGVRRGSIVTVEGVDPAEFGVRIYGPGREVWPPLDPTGAALRPRRALGARVAVGYSVQPEFTGAPSRAGERWHTVRFRGDWLGQAPSEVEGWALACWHHARHYRR